MFFDNIPAIVSEQSTGASARGDSCAETARFLYLKLHLDNTENLPLVNVTSFRTEKGYVRHPDPMMPLDWREGDFSCDQALPLYLTYIMLFPRMAEEMKARIQKAGWRTGNGTLISPMFYAILKGNKFLLNLAVAGQALLFRVPFRWSDSKKAFESSQDASGDYLNWWMGAMQASSWARNLVPPSVLISKVEHYYRNEPNNSTILALYSNSIRRTYGF